MTSLPTGLQPGDSSRPAAQRFRTTRRRSVDPTSRGRRVLIVEDHEDTREVYAWCMRAAGWHVDAVTNGAEALALAAVFEPDVIVLDLHMPVLDGLETMARLKQSASAAKIPVVACTAHGRSYAADTLADAGFARFVDKPCDPEDLLDVIEDVIARGVA